MILVAAWMRFCPILVVISVTVAFGMLQRFVWMVALWFGVVAFVITEGMKFLRKVTCDPLLMSFDIL